MSASVNSGSGFNDGTSSGTSSGSGSSTGSSNSNSSSYIPEYEPQLGFLQQYGNMAGDLANQQYNWASNQFDQNSDLTDQNVNRYLTQHDLASQSAQRDYQNYNDVYNPAIGSLTDDWQSYTSPERVESEMGRSQAGVADNFGAQRRNAERDLQSYGLNPGDARYQGAEAASRTAQAAAEAGAGNQARLNTENTGRQLRGQALQEAHLLPNQQATEQNVSMQGVTGASNAAFGNTSLGALTLGTGRDYLNAGVANNKFQPLGTRSSSTSNNSSQNSTNSHNTSQQHGENQQSGSSMSGGGGGGGGSKGGGSGGGGQGSGGSGSGSPHGGGGGSGPSGGRASMPSNGKNASGGTENDPNDPYYYNDVGMPFLKDGWRDAAPEGGGTDPNGVPGDDGSGWPDAAPEGGGPDPSMDGSGTAWGGDTGSYAQGGAIPDDGDDGGGYVDPSMSPSGGAQTDDVHATIAQTGAGAKLNAGEFVIPEDVTKWYGHKYFQDLIMKARKANEGAPAHPSMGADGTEQHAFGGETGGGMMYNQSGPTKGAIPQQQGFGRLPTYSGSQRPAGGRFGAPPNGGGYNSALPTMRNYATGTARSQFQPQAGGYNPAPRPAGQNSLPQRAPWQPVTRPQPAAAAPAGPISNTAGPTQNSDADHQAFLRSMQRNLGGVQGGNNNAASLVPTNAGGGVAETPAAGVSGSGTGATSGRMMFAGGGAIPENDPQQTPQIEPDLLAAGGDHARWVMSKRQQMRDKGAPVLPGDDDNMPGSLNMPDMNVGAAWGRPSAGLNYRARTAQPGPSSNRGGMRLNLVNQR